MIEDLRHTRFDHDQDWDPDDAPPPPFDREPVIVANHWTDESRIGSGFHLRPEANDREDHWVGGPAHHSGAVCPLCDQSMLLYLDINIRSAVLPEPLRHDFSPFSRLPLYYCPRCPPGTMYRLITDSEIQAIPTARPDYHYTKDQNEQTPFVGYGVPQELERRAVALSLIPESVHLDMIRLWNHNVDHTTPDSSMMESVLDWLEIEEMDDLPVSQFGGRPVFAQGHWPTHCKNGSCPLSYDSVRTVFSDGSPAKKEFALPQGCPPQPFLVQPFATLGPDVVPEMQKSYAWVNFEICWCCLTIYSNYECT